MQPGLIARVYCVQIIELKSEVLCCFLSCLIVLFQGVGEGVEMIVWEAVKELSHKLLPPHNLQSSPSVSASHPAASCPCIHHVPRP